MYDAPTSLLPATVPAGLAGGALALTGADLVWILLAVFALIAAGSALWRVIPRNGEL
ncbi:hypothetical protein JK386_00765 [Nocardioides sp. zg-536]|uniref:Uncharacterized protein n=1 Tax=Nocardioides faecalis TaxID=2803858 RepID=A0A938Y5U5_9ACTN|nr:hypothetical protein [Nocardioides faecalis]MBM9458430.1 hypothetical protein [Nocardioides faecalis]MBS4753262.1 hypothetical protein [Nocardioides faecalis]QVI58445.1 hypothetical protein KG111_15845 [Nocardioides faecalis]